MGPGKGRVLGGQAFECSPELPVEGRQVDVVLVHGHQSEEHDLAVDGVGRVRGWLLLLRFAARLRRSARPLDSLVQKTLDRLERYESKIVRCHPNRSSYNYNFISSHPERLLVFTFFLKVPRPGGEPGIFLVFRLFSLNKAAP